ncbi:MAG: DUF4097 family beta strand repeat-containing protein [Gemella sp.]|nr:DUF4097 family beta strand repeat-containing protein [Gemella sp.]
MNIKKLFSIIIAASLVIFFAAKPTFIASANQNKIELDKDLKSLSISSSIEEIKVFGKSDRNYIELSNDKFNVETGKSTKISQKNSVGTLEDSIKIYLSSDLEELNIDTKHTDIKLFDANIEKINIKNSDGDNKLFNTKAKNIDIKEESGEIVIENQNNLESLSINSSATDIKLFSLESKLLDFKGNDNKIIFTETHSPKLIFDTQKAIIEGQLLTKGNNFKFVDNKETVKTTDHSIYVDKSKNEFSVELK